MDRTVTIPDLMDRNWGYTQLPKSHQREDRMLRVEMHSSRTPAVRLASRPILLVVGISEHSRVLMRGMASILPSAILEVAGCAEAMTLLRLENVQLVICEQNLPDGDWKLLLEGADELVHRPNVIVASRLADHRLWAEVLNLGAYDLLPLPFEPTEAGRVVSRAWDSKRGHGETANGYACCSGADCAAESGIVK